MRGEVPEEKVRVLRLGHAAMIDQERVPHGMQIELAAREVDAFDRIDVHIVAAAIVVADGVERLVKITDEVNEVLERVLPVRRR